MERILHARGKMTRQRIAASSLTIFTVALGTFMSSFDINATNIALPLIQKSFKTSIGIVQWVVVAYLLTLCATQLTLGRVSDLYGRKKIYSLGFACFTVSSALCALSHSIAVLIVFRIIQALSAAMMTSTSSAIITSAVPPERRGKALSFTAIAVAIAAVVGPTLGGLLASTFGWQSIFLINIPIGILGTIFSVRFIATDTVVPGERFDFLGSSLIILALVFTLSPLDLISLKSISVVNAILLITCGIGFFVFFILHEKKSPHPILNIKLFSNRMFANSNFAATFFYTAEFMMIFLAPYYLQQQRALTPSMAGVLMFPMSLAMMTFAPISGSMSDKFGSRIISSVGMLVMAFATLSFSGFKADTPLYWIIVFFAIAGSGAGLFITPNNSAIMGSVTAEYRGVAGATLATMRTVGMVTGEALAAMLLSVNLAHGTTLFTSQGLTGPALQQSAFGYAMRITCIVSAVFTLLAMVFSLTRGKRQSI